MMMITIILSQMWHVQPRSALLRPLIYLHRSSNSSYVSGSSKRRMNAHIWSRVLSLKPHPFELRCFWLPISKHATSSYSALLIPFICPHHLVITIYNILKTFHSDPSAGVSKRRLKNSKHMSSSTARFGIVSVDMESYQTQHIQPSFVAFWNSAGQDIWTSTVFFKITAINTMFRSGGGEHMASVCLFLQLRQTTHLGFVVNVSGLVARMPRFGGGALIESREGGSNLVQEANVVQYRLVILRSMHQI